MGWLTLNEPKVHRGVWSAPQVRIISYFVDSVTEREANILLSDDLVHVIGVGESRATIDPEDSEGILHSLTLLVQERLIPREGDANGA